jgi:hypothetical protein
MAGCKAGAAQFPGTTEWLDHELDLNRILNVSSQNTLVLARYRVTHHKPGRRLRIWHGVLNMLKIVRTRDFEVGWGIHKHAANR